MATVRISLTRALALIKSSADLCVKLSTNPWVGLAKANGTVVFPPVVAGDSETNVSALIQASYDRFNSLLAQRSDLRLKVAAINSSPEHLVTFRGQSFTINQLMEKRNFEVTMLTSLLGQMLEQLSKAQQTDQNNATQMDTRIRQGYSSWLNAAKQTSPTKEEADNVMQSLTAMEQGNVLHLIDPITIRTKIKELQDELHSLKTEIDFCLSEANSRFEIEVDASFASM